VSAFRYHEVGVFDRDTQTYSVTRIPAPPQAKAVVDVDPMGRSAFIGYDVKAACPKCLAPMVLSWRNQTTELAMESMHGMDASVAVEAMQVARNATARAERAEKRAWDSEKAFRAIQATKAKRAKHKRRRRSQRGRR